MSVHTIWIPAGWSVEQVWETIKRGDMVPDDGKNKGRWVNVNDKGKVVA